MMNVEEIRKIINGSVEKSGLAPVDNSGTSGGQAQRLANPDFSLSEKGLAGEADPQGKVVRGLGTESPAYLDTYRLSRQGCGTKVIRLVCKDCGHTFWTHKYCGLRTCPVCSRKQANEIFNRFKPIVTNLDYKYGMSLKLITLTSIRVGGLKKTVKHTIKMFRRLYHNELEHKGSGALLTIEFGKKTLNTHLHILYYGKYINRNKLQKEWKRLTGAYVVDVRRVAGVGALRYVTKYIVKQDNFNDDISFKIENTLKGIRRIITYGIFYNCKKTKRQTKCEACGSSRLKYKTVEDMTDFIYEQILGRRTVMRANNYFNSA